MSEPQLSRVRHFLREGRRRKVYQVTAAYVALSVALVTVADVILRALLLPDWSIRLVVVLLLLGLPVAVLLAWAYDVTPEGVKRTAPLDAPASPAGASGPEGGAGDAGAHSGGAPLRTPPQRMGVRGAFRGMWPPGGGRAVPARGRAVPGGGPASGAGAGTAMPPGARATAGVPAPASPDPDESDGSPPAAAAPADPERVKRATIGHLRHELRTPINAILGYSEMILEDADIPVAEVARGDLKKIHAGGKQLLARVNETLDPERAGAIDRDLRAFEAQLQHDLRTPANAVIGYAELLIETAADQGLEAAVPDLERVLKSAKQILAMIGDLVALAETSTGGEARTAEFTRSSAMTKQVLETMGAARARAESKPPELHHASLLVVDDNAINRDLLSRQLARQGYTVSTAESGPQALELLETEPFDLVLLDIIMPEMNGIQVLQQIKRNEGLRDIPVVMISSLDDVDSVVRCIEAGADDYVSKPFDPVLLAARIGAKLEMRRLREREKAYALQLDQHQVLLDDLLVSLFPASVAARFRAGEAAPADAYDEITVGVAELDGAARLAARSGPAELAARLGELVTTYRALAEQAGAEVVRAGGRSVVVAAGLDGERPDHAAAVADLLLRMVAATQEQAAERGDGFRIRAGIHTGPAVGSVFGVDCLGFDLWGDAMEMAQRIAVQASAGTVQVTAASHAHLRDRFAMESLGVVEIGGKGQMRTYVLREPRLATPPG